MATAATTKQTNNQPNKQTTKRPLGCVVWCGMVWCVCALCFFLSGKKAYKKHITSCCVPPHLLVECLCVCACVCVCVAVDVGALWLGEQGGRGEGRKEGRAGLGEGKEARLRGGREPSTDRCIHCSILSVYLSIHRLFCQTKQNQKRKPKTKKTKEKKKTKTAPPNRKGIGLKFPNQDVDIVWQHK